MPTYNSEVILGNEVLISLRTDTVTPETLIQGATAHDCSGAPIVGTAKIEEKPYFDGNKIVFPSSEWSFEGTKLVYDGVELNGNKIVVN